MPMFETYATTLNTNTSPANITAFAANANQFAPGQPLDFEFMMPAGNPLAGKFKAFLSKAPGSFKETLRSVLFHALSSQPPIPVTVAWSPGYDFAISVTQSPPTAQTQGFITIKIQTRYPDDPHPIG
jgi:hypothetical protein